MVESTPQTKRNEQYPLLKVEGGGGDGGARQQPSPTLDAPGWGGVRCTPKQFLIVRWPEYISACWMTMILLGISFLVFYTLGMAYRRQPVLIIKCNVTKPASDVYFHQIVQRGTSVPFSLYADYLANMATQYPLLNFHVFFLMDDSLHTTFRGLRHVRLVNKMMPYSSPNAYTYYEEENNKRELAEFEAKYQNVNITVMSLSKFMATTPLKFKWRTIPHSYITFYARVFSVWQNGGVGMDLTTFNNNYNSHKCVDRRISAIMKQHNDGIKVEEYTSALNKIAREEENEYFNLFHSLIFQILNDTRALLSKSFPFSQITGDKVLPQNKLLVPSDRTERDVPAKTSDQNTKSEVFSNVYVETLNSTNKTDLKKNEYQTLPNSELHLDKLKVTTDDSFKTLVINNTSSVNGVNKTERLNKSEIQTEIMNKSDGTQVVLFYDFTVFSDGFAAPFMLPEQRTDFRQKVKTSESGKAGKYGNNGAYLLSIDSGGMFVAAASRLHPFLGHLISTGCQRMHHKFVIHDTLISQCSGVFKDGTYCNNIYLLYL